LVRFSATPASRYHIIYALLYKVQGLTLAALIIMLNKETAQHDLATLYVGISRVTRLRDLKIWPINCNDKRAIKHLVSIKRPGFISLWRKGYNDKGLWMRSQLAYTKLRAATELLGELHAAGDFAKNTMKELRRLLGKCHLERLDTKATMAKRLQQKTDELVELINAGRSPSKRKQRPHNAMASPQPKRRKRTARQRRGAGDADASPRPRNSGSRSRSRKRRPRAQRDSPPPQSSSSSRRNNPVAPTATNGVRGNRPIQFA
jgi:hypothetical protein